MGTVLGEELNVQLEGAGVDNSSGPAVALFGDISRFLPLEDRIRVVSWVER